MELLSCCLQKYQQQDIIALLLCFLCVECKSKFKKKKGWMKLVKTNNLEDNSLWRTWTKFKGDTKTNTHKIHVNKLSQGHRKKLQNQVLQRFLFSFLKLFFPYFSTAVLKYVRYWLNTKLKKLLLSYFPSCALLTLTYWMFFCCCCK